MVKQQSLSEGMNMARVEQRGAGKPVAQSPARLALAWAVVTVPAAWGIYNTVLRAAHLFAR